MHHVLSIQSAVAYGHAGNSSAVFPLQRMGVNVWPVYTVNFSNHTGYGAWRGPMIAAPDVAEVVTGIDERGVLGRADALLSGYLGSPEVAHVIVDAAALVKQRNPQAIYCADPVMGDVDRGFYARPGIPELIRDTVVPSADIMTPNLFELEFLVGRDTAGLDDVVQAANELRQRGPETVLVTSVLEGEEPTETMRMLAVGPSGSWIVETPRIQRTFTGSGDLTTAVFLTHWLETKDLGQALSNTASVVYSVLEQTERSGERELQLVAAQSHLVDPEHRFDAAPLI